MTLPLLTFLTTLVRSRYISIYFPTHYIGITWTLAWWLECLPMAWETGVQSQVESYQRLKKWYLIPTCLTLSIIRYRSRVKWSNSGKAVAPYPTPWCSSYRKGSLLVTLDYGRKLYFTLLLINLLIVGLKSVYVILVPGGFICSDFFLAALSAFSPPGTKITYTDLRPTISKFINNKWQEI